MGSGQQLLADFQTAFVSAATIEAAKYEAAQSENELLDHLSAVGGGAYLQPTDMSARERDDLTRNSLDAHIKKVQAQQLSSMSVMQLQQLQAQARTTYVGRKILVTSLRPKSNAIETVWFDQRTGFRSNITHKPKVSGTIQDVLLDRNVLILRPSLGTRLLNTNLESYMIYVIDPTTVKPLVTFTLA